MKLSELKGKQAVAMSEAAKVGAVYDVFLDATFRRIEALVLRPDDRGPEYVVPGRNISAIGQDVVTIDSRNSLQSLEQATNVVDLPRMGNLLKSRIVTRSGQVLGEISDFDFDPVSGEIRGYEYDGGSLKGMLGRRHVLDPKNIITFGPGIVTVTDDARPTKAA